MLIVAVFIVSLTCSSVVFILLVMLSTYAYIVPETFRKFICFIYLFYTTG